jgi:hypothetical protein
VTALFASRAIISAGILRAEVTFGIDGGTIGKCAVRVLGAIML